MESSQDILNETEYGYSVAPNRLQFFMVGFLRYQLLYFKPFQASCLACVLHLPGTGNIQIGGRNTHLTDLIYSLYTHTQQTLTMHLAPSCLGGRRGGGPCHIFQKHPTPKTSHNKCCPLRSIQWSGKLPAKRSELCLVGKHGGWSRFFF